MAAVDPMFEDVVDLWKQYLTVQAPSWASDDPRQGLGAEVRKCLNQLDIVLQHLQASMAAVAIDPEDARLDFGWMRDAGPRVSAGEMTEEEYFAGFQTAKRSREQWRAFARAFDEVQLFTETFYFVAWRLVVILRVRGPLGFPGLTKLRAKGIRVVRNDLLQHPEKHFQQTLIVTDAGPVLKSSGGVMRMATGRIDPLDESDDRGLFPNAQELHDELLSLLRGAVA